MSCCPTQYISLHCRTVSSHAIQCSTITHQLIALLSHFSLHRQDMIYEACELLTRSKVVTEMPFPRIATLLHMKLEDIVTGLEQMIAGAPGTCVHTRCLNNTNIKYYYDLRPYFTDPMVITYKVTFRQKLWDR